MELRHPAGVSITARVENNTIKLPPGLDLPDGTEVSVTFLSPSTAPGFLRAVLARARPRDWPADYALNHAHYTKGEPSR